MDEVGVLAPPKGRRIADPRIDVVGGKYVFSVRIDDVGVVEEQKREGPTGRTGIDRLPKPVQNEDLSVQGGVHEIGTLAISPPSSNEIGGHHIG
jgi:hypothetical protein